MRPQENQSRSSRNVEAAQRRRNAKKSLLHQVEKLTEENRQLNQLNQQIRDMAFDMAAKKHEIINSLRQMDGGRQLQVAGGSSHGEKDITEMDDEKHERYEQGLWEIDTESAADEKS
jgi:hypothetical protein